MTSDLTFECLLVSRDESLFRTIARILRGLSISIDLCFSSERACDQLSQTSRDLVVIDWEGEASSELLYRIWQGGKSRKPIVVAISDTGSPLPGAHFVLKKPVTAESAVKAFQEAYSIMLLDYRRSVRYAVMVPAVAALDDGRRVPVRVTDIGDGGLGLSAKEQLAVGDVLSFRLPLSGVKRDILVNVRVLWTREFGRTGCEFVSIPPVDLMILQDWLKSKMQVKKPLTLV
jgi:hypothetical protein